MIELFEKIDNMDPTIFLAIALVVLVGSFLLQRFLNKNKID